MGCRRRRHRHSIWSSSTALGGLSVMSCTRLLSVIVALSLLLTACGTGRTLVMESPQRKSFSGVTLMRADDTVTVPDEVREQFVSKMRELLYGAKEAPGPFTEGAGLTIRVK